MIENCNVIVTIDGSVTFELHMLQDESKTENISFVCSKSILVMNEISI